MVSQSVLAQKKTSNYFDSIEAEEQYRLDQYRERIKGPYCNASPEEKNLPTTFDKDSPAIDLLKYLPVSWNLYSGYGSGCATDCVFDTPISCSLPNASKYLVPVVFTVSTTTGCATTPVSQATIDAQLSIMNDFFACQGIPIVYYKCTMWTGHPTTGDLSTRYADLGCTYSDGVVSEIANVINIYIFSDTGNGSGCNGFAPLAFNTMTSTRVLMANACFNGFAYTSGTLGCTNSNLGLGQVLVHELGHYFGLFHTHDKNTNGEDDPNISTDDCTKGDLVADTDEDPDFSGGEVASFGCVSVLESDCTPNLSDPDCAPYGTPNTIPNIMSYNYYTGCINQFTTCQKARIMDALLGARGLQMCCRDVATEFAIGLAGTELTICAGDPAPTFTASSNCYAWYSGLGASASSLASGTATFTPSLGSGTGLLNNNVVGVYNWYLGDINELNPNCRTLLKINVIPNPGILAPLVDDKFCCGETESISITNYTVAECTQTVGLWVTAGTTQPASSYFTPSQLTTDNAAGYILAPTLTYSNSTGTYDLTESCDAGGNPVNFPAGNYCITPFISKKNIPLQPLIVQTGSCGTSTGFSNFSAPPCFSGETCSVTPTGAPLADACNYRPVPQFSLNIVVASITTSHTLSVAPSGTCNTDSATTLGTISAPGTYTYTQADFPANFDASAGLCVFAYVDLFFCTSANRIDFSTTLTLTYPEIPASNLFPSLENGCFNPAICFEFMAAPALPVVADPACQAFTTFDLNTLNPSPLPADVDHYEWHTASSNPTTLTRINNPTPVSSPGTYYIYAVNSAGCFSTGDPVTLSVPPTIPTNTDPSPVCEGTAVTLTGTGSTGGGFTGYTFWDAASGGNQYLNGVGGYTINTTSLITPTSLAPNTYEYYVQAEGNCPSSRKKVTIQINNQPEAGTASPTTICETSTTVIDLYAQLAGEDAGGVWTAAATNPSGGTFTAASGSFDPSGASVSVYSFTYSFAAGGGCIADDATVDITVQNQGEAGTGSAITRCETNTTLITLSDLVTGEETGGSWAATAGNPVGGTFDAIAGTFDPTGASIGTYNFSYSFAAGAACVADNTNLSITIENQPEAGTDGSLTICETQTTAVDLLAIISGEDAGGTWTASATNPSGGTLTGASFDPIGATPGTYTFSYSFAAGTDCVADASTATLVITEQKEAGTASPTTICETSTTVIDLYAQLAGEDAGGVWTAAATNPIGGTFTAASGSFDPSGASVGSYSFTYSFAEGGGCIADDATVNVTVENQGEAGSGTSTNVCSNAGAVNLFGLVSGEDTGGLWTASAGNPVGGTFNAAAGSFDPAGAPNGAYTFTYSFAAGTACIVDATSVTIHVGVQPEAGTASPTTICETSTTVIDLYAQIAGEDAGGVWTAAATNPSGGTFTAASGSFDPSGASVGSYSFTYSFAAGGGCIADDATVDITVQNQGEAGIDMDATLCNNETNINLNDFLVNADLGGSWSQIAGSTNLILNENIIESIGNTVFETYSLQYSLDGGLVCTSDIAILTLSVWNAPEGNYVILGACPEYPGSDIGYFTLTDAENANAVSNLSNIAVQGTNPIVAVAYYPTYPIIGVEELDENSLSNFPYQDDRVIYVIITDPESGCSDIAPISLNVFEQEVISINPSPYYCVDSQSESLSALLLNNMTAQGDFTLNNAMAGWSSENGILNFNPSLLGVGLFEYTYNETTDDGCVYLIEGILEIIECCELPMANAGSDRSVCINEPTVLGGNPAVVQGSTPYTIQWSPSGGLSCTNCANPQASPLTTTTYTLTISNACGISTDQVEVEVLEGSPFELGGAINICAEDIPYTLIGPAGYNAYIWSSGGATLGLTQNMTITGPGVYQLITYDQYFCVWSDVIIINLIPDCSSATATFASDICICLNNAIDGDHGQFSQLHYVNSNPGETWTVASSTGLYLISSPTPPALPIPLANGTALTEVSPGLYEIEVIHEDGAGFTLTVSNGSIALSTAGSCSYPNPVLNLNPQYCNTDGVIALPGVSGGTYYVDGNAVSEINTVTISLGNHTAELVIADELFCTQSSGILHFTIIDCPAQNFIGNFVWIDYNGDGQQEAGEPGLAGVQIFLYGASGEYIATTTSDENGYYYFDDPGAGYYYLQFIMPNGYGLTAANAGGNEFTDSDFNAVTLSTDLFPIGENENLSFDLGLVLLVSICDEYFSSSVANCAPDYTSYEVEFSVILPGIGPVEYIVSSTHPGGYEGFVTGTYTDGPFANATGYHYEITVVDHPECTFILEEALIECSITPIVLVDFKGELQADYNFLSWTTATEVNNDYFTLYRSDDGQKFLPITVVDGAGDSDHLINYSFSDKDVYPGVFYYRLDHTDFNGNTRSSQVITLVRSTVADDGIFVHPIPAIKELAIEWVADKDGTIRMKVIDILGRQIDLLAYDSIKGYNSVIYDISHLPSGTYFIATIEDKPRIIKFVRE